MSRRLSWNSAVKRWRHYMDEPCPVTGEPVDWNLVYTDHERGGYEEGVFRIVFFNICPACGGSIETVGQRLHKLNEARRIEAEKKG